VIDYHEYLRPKKPGSRDFDVDRAAFDAGRRRSGAPGCASSTACREPQRRRHASPRELDKRGRAADDRMTSTLELLGCGMPDEAPIVGTSFTSFADAAKIAFDQVPGDPDREGVRPPTSPGSG
jgi:hypothetical protein